MPDFGRRAATYDALRPVDDNWRELFELLVREAELEGARVLDVGCGTGRVAAALAGRADAVGVEPSAPMREIARGRGVDVEAGRAEELPFGDDSFDAAVLWLVIHLLDRPRALAEMRRVLVPGARLAVATFDPAHFDTYWLNHLFPSLEAVDRVRFPTQPELDAELHAAEFPDVRFTTLHQRDSLDREIALERIRGRHISTFDLIGEEEYAAGLARAERELPARVDYVSEWLVAIAR